MTTTTAPGANLGQTEVWVDRAGAEHRIDDMSVRYKANVVAYLERNAPRIVAQSVERKVADDPEFLGRALAARSTTIPCVLCGGEDDPDFRPHEWAHGVWHGAGPMPGSEIDAMLADADADRPLGLVIAGLSDADAVTIIRRTPLVARLIDDVAAGRGGQED